MVCPSVSRSGCNQRHFASSFSVASEHRSSCAAWFEAKVHRGNEAHDYLNLDIIITGGSCGIGFATAQRFLAKGARVTICAKDTARLAAAEKELVNRGPTSDDLLPGAGR
jgi:hypothetical protein